MIYWQSLLLNRLTISLAQVLHLEMALSLHTKFQALTSLEYPKISMILSLSTLKRFQLIQL